MRKLAAALFLFLTVITISCSKRIFEAEETHKLHDNYFILRKNGRYSIKMLMMGLVRMPDSEHGRYILLADTVYMVKKKGRNLYETYSYGVIDSAERKFTYYISDTIEPRIFYFSNMLGRKSK